MNTCTLGMLDEDGLLWIKAYNYMLSKSNGTRSYGDGTVDIYSCDERLIKLYRSITTLDTGVFLHRGFKQEEEITI